MGGHDLTVVWVGMGEDVLDQVVAVLVTGNYEKSQ